MKKRSFDEMIAYFNRKVADMEIDRKYKMELLGMITAILQEHDSTVEQQRWIPVTEFTPDENLYSGIGQHSTCVLATVEICHGGFKTTNVDMLYTLDGEWKLCHSIDGDDTLPDWCEVTAWQPLPEPYKEESE